MRISSHHLVLWLSSVTTASSFRGTTRAFSRYIQTSGSVLTRFDRVGTSTPNLSRFQSSALRMSSSETAAEKSLRVALCQFHVTGDKEENYKTAKDFLSQAAKQGAQMAILPEIWNSPYATAAFPEYAESMPGIGDSSSETSPSSQVLIDAAKEHGIWIVGGSIPERAEEDGTEKIYNTCLVLNPEGVIVAKHRKVHLFDIDVPGGITFFESETLSAGQTVSHFKSPFGEIGVGVCYDIRFAEYAMLLRQKYNCNIIIYPGAFNMTTGPAHWMMLQQGRAIDNQCFIITASPARTEPPENTESLKYPHYTAWGHSTVVSPWGDIVATTDEKAGVVIADLDLGRVDEVRRGI
eukprot:CAMPEP_0176126454 /NCGR_PEP_ID=MMETSP0120_2-20121206/63825_1 /TAXON_ID=160619 /ORGANISM="Kryptoperidinium foliaceum, Strain CCMP 1326" /LENGTH=350 /DNA_ID=CAMNT_0017461383 /DNA_START=66 /DNA_END=1115 /DNA_ORIENTATION=-